MSNMIHKSNSNKMFNVNQARSDIKYRNEYITSSINRNSRVQNYYREAYIIIAIID